MKRAPLTGFVLALTLWASASHAAEKLKGYVWDVQGERVVVEGVPVEVSSTTRIVRENQPDVRAADLRIGWELEVEGSRTRSGSLLASSIKVKNKRGGEIKVEGFVEEIRSGSLYVDGRDVFFPPGFRRDAVSRGMQVKGKGVVRDDGAVELSTYELKPRGRDAGEEKFLTLASQELDKIKGKLKFYDDRLFQQYVNRVGQRLVPDYVDRDEIRFNFSIVDDPDLNAFALPDGTIVIHTGLLAVLENEAQLAAVLGHEIAHVTNKHSYRGYKAAQKLQWAALGAAVAGAVIDAKSDRAPWQGPSLGSVLFSVGAMLALTAAVNGHGRNLEDDADRIGLRYATEAGYDPLQAPEVWKAFDKHIKDQSAAVNWFFSDHSTHRARISNLTREINQHYRGKVDTAQLNVNADEYQRAVARLRRHTAIRDYERKEYRNAEKAFRELLEKNPGDAVSHMYLGNIYRDLDGGRESARAFAEYRRAIALDPELPDPYRELGFYYYGLGDHEKAVESFQTYLKMAPQAQDGDAIRYYIREISK